MTLDKEPVRIVKACGHPDDPRFICACAIWAERPPAPDAAARRAARVEGGSVTPEEFLAARLDEDEAAAKRCAEVFPSPWDVVDRGYSAEVKADEPDFRVVTALDERKVPKREGSWWLSEYLEHIARYDPARVLREVEAKRALLRDHSDRHVCEDTMAGPTWNWDADGGRQVVADPCRVLRVILEIWSDHPDYDAAKWSEDQ